MFVRRFNVFGLAVMVCALLLATTPIFAQVTTGGIAGTVVSDADNSALPGVTVEAVHTPTGTRYSTVSGAGGRYTLPNVRVGGPYKVTGSLEGFKPAKTTGVEGGLGTPSGQANTQPISLDAIQTLQLVVSPYDVRQGGFTGGGVNAVTRSGTNKIEGSVYGSKRNANWVGDGPNATSVPNFTQNQWGG